MTDARVGRSQGIIYRSMSMTIVFSLVLIPSVALIVLGFVFYPRDRDVGDLVVAGIFAPAGFWFGLLFGYYARVVVRADGLLVVNPLITSWIPWSAIREIDTDPNATWLKIRTDRGVTRPWIWQRTNLALATGTKRNTVDRMGAMLRARLREATSSPAENEVRRLVRPNSAVVLITVALWVALLLRYYASNA